MFLQPAAGLLIVGCGVMLCWRRPGLRRYARLMMPFILTAIGLLALMLVTSDASFGGQAAVGRAESWRNALVAQSVAFLVAGVWLGGNRYGTGLRLVGRSGRLLWNLLLPPALAVLAILLFHDHSYPGLTFDALAVVITLSVMIGRPAVAADLTAAALTLLGVVGIANAAWPPPFPRLTLFTALPIPDGGHVVSSTVAVSGTLDLLAAVQGAAILAFGLWLVPRTIGVHARALRRPAADPLLAGRVEQLTQTRADAVDSAAAELRRVERDLHDGAQARLVALGMNLRAAERLIHTSPQAAVALVTEARQASSLALTELRDLVRGIYPPVLADRGLADAVQALALDTPVSTQTDIDLPGRLDAPVEAACYFAIAEALANAVKHSGARLVQVRIRHSAAPRRTGPPAPGLLRIEITDDGAGGADPANGTGLAGIERRLGTFDGILAVSSPPGGPTMIIMEVPCALSSPRTSSC